MSKKITIRATFSKTIDYDEEKYGLLNVEKEREITSEDPFSFMEDARVVLTNFVIETHE